MNYVFLIPLTLVYSIIGFIFSLNVLIEMIFGYELPGNGLALMFLKAMSCNIDGQAPNYITEQKIGRYLRILPRALFRCQMLSVLIRSFISLTVLNFAIDNIDGYCTHTQLQRFTCPGARTFYASLIFWGVIGPKKTFNGLYPIMSGVSSSACCWHRCFAVKKYLGHCKLVRYFHSTLFIGGLLIYAPYNLSYFTPGLIVAFFFMHVIKKRYLTWFKE